VFEVKLPLGLSEQKVGDQQDLSHPEHQVDGEEVVGVGAAVVDPHLMHHRAENCGGHKHVSRDKDLFHVGEEMSQNGQDCQVQSDVAVAGIRLEYGGEGDEAPRQ